MTTTPKTIDLPPEPPIGAEWRDCDGHQWRHEPEGWTLQGGTTRYAWSTVCRYLPLALIEPDPWPTAPLIVADWTDGDQLGRGLLVADGPTPSECYVVLTGDDDYDGYRLLRRGWDGDTLANVVPVTVVPTAELEDLGKKVRALDMARTDKQRRVVVTRAAELLLEAINALGLDQ